VWAILQAVFAAAATDQHATQLLRFQPLSGATAWALVCQVALVHGMGSSTYLLHTSRSHSLKPRCHLL
jgi:spore maturation protein SpmB